MNDILLNEKDDLVFGNGDFVVGDSTIQDVSQLLRLNQGESKEDPIIGPGLIRLIKSKINISRLRALVKKHLLRDGKNYDEVQKYITINNDSYEKH